MVRQKGIMGKRRRPTRVDSPGFVVPKYGNKLLTSIEAQKLTRYTWQFNIFHAFRQSGTIMA